LIRALGDEEPSIRAQAARAFVSIQDVRAVEPLVALLYDQEEDVRKGAERGLIAIGEPAVESLLEVVNAGGLGRRWAVFALRHIPDPRAFEPMLAALSDQDPIIRRAAAWALGAIGDTRAVVPLLKALRDEEVANRALWALRWISGKVTWVDWEPEDERAVPALAQVLQNGDDNIREKAVWVLGEIGAERAVPVLIRALQDASQSVRGGAATALRKIGDPQAVPALAQVLGDESATVRECAARALASMGMPAEEVLAAAVGNENPRVRKLAQRAIEKIERRKANAKRAAAEEAPREQASTARLENETRGVITGQELVARQAKAPDLALLESSIETLRDSEDVEARTKAAWSIGYVAGRPVSPIVGTFMETCSGTAPGLGTPWGERAVEALVEALADAEPLVQSAAAKALGAIGDPAGVEPLTEALSDEDEVVVYRVAWALGQIGDARGVEPLVSVFTDPKYADAVPKRYGMTNVRVMVAFALSFIADIRPVEPLLQALGDENELVRLYASRALAAIGKPALSAVVRGRQDGDKNTRIVPLRVLEQMGRAGIPEAQGACKVYQTLGFP